MFKKSASLALACLFAASGAYADDVDLKGFHAKVEADLTDLGHLAELNGKYRIRVTEVTMDPGGYMHAHHHLGPASAACSRARWKYEIGGKTTIYKAGDCFTETGAMTHESSNVGTTPVVLLNFELLPRRCPRARARSFRFRRSSRAHPLGKGSDCARPPDEGLALRA